MSLCRLALAGSSCVLKPRAPRLATLKLLSAGLAKSLSPASICTVTRVQEIPSGAVPQAVSECARLHVARFVEAAGHASDQARLLNDGFFLLKTAPSRVVYG